LIPALIGAAAVYFGQQAHIQHLKQQLNEQKIDAYSTAVEFTLSLTREILKAKGSAKPPSEFAALLLSLQDQLHSARTKLLMFGSDSVVKQFAQVHDIIKGKDLDRTDRQAVLEWAETLLREQSKLALSVRKEFTKTKFSDDELFLEILGYKRDKYILSKSTSADEPN
tara:strand:+ start:77 stop:580 length:504 start_codon:yes stop_codon:yes gene_type:complete